MALVGFQGRGCAEVVQPHSGPPFLLEVLILQWPSKGMALLGQRWSRRPRNPIRAIHDIHRFPRVQDFVSYCRLVKCAKASGGKRLGTSGAKIGNAHLKWAFSEAAVLFLRDHPAAQKYLARLEKKHDKGKALTILAQKLARAVYYMLKRKVAFDTETFFQR